jgi:hypothetical protein
MSAERAIRELQAAGFSGTDIGIVMQDRTEATGLAEDTGTHVAADAATGAVAGGVVGGVGAAVLGLGSLFIPGVGPFLAGGILVAALGGALTGGIIGALVGLGFSEDEAGYYDEEIRGGRTLVTCRCDDLRAPEARRIMNAASGRFYDANRTAVATGTTTYPTTGAGIDFGPHRAWNEAMPEWRDRWQTRYGAGGERWEDYEPGYRYAYEKWGDTRYHNRSWDEVEPDLRSGYSTWATHSGYRDEPNAWDRFRMKLREMWDDLRGRDYAAGYRRDEHVDTRI